MLQKISRKCRFDSVITFKIVPESVVKPWPAIVSSDTLGDNGPVISLRKSDAVTDLYVVFGKPLASVVTTFCGSGESIHNCRIFGT